jgi:putative mycofactocin binding protein MftB
VLAVSFPQPGEQDRHSGSRGYPREPKTGRSHQGKDRGKPASVVTFGGQMQSHSVYSLKDGVQVRKEKFGLLFYNYAGPRLFFVPTQDLINNDFFEGKQKVKELIDHIESKHNWPRQWIEDRVGQILKTLEQKGLIYGQSVC